MRHLSGLREIRCTRSLTRELVNRKASTVQASLIIAKSAESLSMVPRLPWADMPPSAEPPSRPFHSQPCACHANGRAPHAKPPNHERGNAFSSSMRAETRLPRLNLLRRCSRRSESRVSVACSSHVACHGAQARMAKGQAKGQESLSQQRQLGRCSCFCLVLRDSQFGCLNSRLGQQGK